MNKDKQNAVNTVANSMIGCGCLMLLLVGLGAAVGVAVFH